MSREPHDSTPSVRADGGRRLPKSIGRYEIVRLLGTGAMGRVFLALDPVLRREVAIKILRRDLAIPEDVREGLVVRMRHEAQAAARVTHPNLVVLHDMGEDPELGLYLVFELLEGPTLRERIAETRLRPREAAKLARELGGALAFAHARGVLHRDVKPDNIILTPTGAKIADFGIARVPDSTLTHAGGLLGTPAYSAPETFQKGAFSAASDQFSLAATLYEAVSGERAFPGDDAVLVAARIASGGAEPFATRIGYAPTLDDVFARATARFPEERFESCAAFGTALARALDPTPSDDEEVDDVRSSSVRAADDAAAVRSAADRSTTAARPERKPWQILIGGLVVVIVVALLVRAALKNRDAALAEPAAASAASASAAPSTSAPQRAESRETRPLHRPSAASPPAVSTSPPTESAEAPTQPVPPAPSAAPATSATP